CNRTRLTGSIRRLKIETKVHGEPATSCRPCEQAVTRRSPKIRTGIPVERAKLPSGGNDPPSALDRLISLCIASTRGCSSHGGHPEALLGFGLSCARHIV